MPKEYKITFGGWYQRTTLHLTEVYDFLAYGMSRLDLNKEKLSIFHSKLNLEQVSREAEGLEYVKAKTLDDIDIKYYEDGLYVLSIISDDVGEAKENLSSYFSEIFEPAISYIFSLGAPTPKVLANIKRFHPTVVSLTKKKPQEFKVNDKFGEIYSKISSKETTVFKTPGYIFVVSGQGRKHLDDLVEMQIFFREFKDQLEKYLNIHRDIWEEIAAIKEKGEIRGKDIGELRSKLDGYEKTISLINNRINQMGSYIDTRRSIAETVKVEKNLVSLFQYKFETLKDTHGYIHELWRMTYDYLKSAIQIIVELENQSTNVSIESLTTVTMVGVISGVLGYLATDSLPGVTPAGAVYFGLLIVATWLANRLITKVYRDKKYKIEFTEREKNI
jgi:hypothetical protein